MNKKIIPVILCGGQGTRLWPASKKETPKQFLKLLGENSLLQDTAKRAMRVSGCKPQDIVTVSHVGLKNQIIEHYSAIDEGLCAHILSEPCARGTGPAIALAALYIRQNFGPEAVMWVLPSDHYIGDESALGEALIKAISSASQGILTTFGIHPSKPETGYGYINAGAAFREGILEIKSFTEKPDVKEAAHLLGKGQCFWNSGMFIFKASAALKAFKAHAPEVLEKIYKSCRLKNQKIEITEDIYQTIQPASFDILIMEKTGNRAVIPANPAWSDVGSWDNLWELHEKSEGGNVLKGNVMLSDCQNMMVQSDKQLIACLGLTDIIIIETPEAILVARKGESNNLKTLVSRLKESEQIPKTIFQDMHDLEEVI